MSESADLDGDGRPERVAITYKRWEKGHPVGGQIVVSRGGKVLSRHERLNPWKVQIANVDGDGQKEVVVGVYKKSPFDPVMAKRPFVYNWNGERLVPRWLGSRLSRRFTDFALADLDADGKDELVVLEVASEDKKYVTVYRWKGFGFEWVGRIESKAGLTKILKDVDGRSSRLRVVGKDASYVVTLESDKPKLKTAGG